MNKLRTRVGQWMVVAVLALSLVPTAAVSALHVAQAPAAPYAQWLRSQLRAPADATVEAALHAAQASRARSLDVFLEAFVEAYEKAGGAPSLGAVFALGESSREVIIARLQSRYRGFSAFAFSPRELLTVASAWAGALPNARLHGLPPIPELLLKPLLRAQLTPAWVWLTPAYGVRLLGSALQPLGP